jgi:hypothetical protein
MSQVELRNQERTEEIRKIRALLLPGDITKIQTKAGKSYRATHDTLNENHPLWSKGVIDAAWEYLTEVGRVKTETAK